MMTVIIFQLYKILSALLKLRSVFVWFYILILQQHISAIFLNTTFAFWTQSLLFVLILQTYKYKQNPRTTAPSFSISTLSHTPRLHNQPPSPSLSRPQGSSCLPRGERSSGWGPGQHTPLFDLFRVGCYLQIAYSHTHTALPFSHKGSSTSLASSLSSSALQTVRAVAGLWLFTDELLLSKMFFLGFFFSDVDLRLKGPIFHYSKNIWCFNAIWNSGGKIQQLKGFGCKCVMCIAWPLCVCVFLFARMCVRSLSSGYHLKAELQLMIS